MATKLIIGRQNKRTERIVGPRKSASPSARVAGPSAAATVTKASTGEGGKVWLKPKKTTTPVDDEHQQQPKPKPRTTIGGSTSGSKTSADSSKTQQISSVTDKKATAAVGSVRTTHIRQPPMPKGMRAPESTTVPLVPKTNDLTWKNGKGVTSRKADDEKDSELSSGDFLLTAGPILPDSRKSSNASSIGNNRRPSSLENSVTNGVEPSVGAKEPAPRTVVRTTQVKSPEEVTGVRSPSPESWTVPLVAQSNELHWIGGGGGGSLVESQEPAKFSSHAHIDLSLHPDIKSPIASKLEPFSESITATQTGLHTSEFHFINKVVEP